MKFEYSMHWLRKKRKRKDITYEALEYAIMNSPILRDKYWDDVFNAICEIPPSGRLLKVVYKRKSDRLKILTAFWVH